MSKPRTTKVSPMNATNAQICQMKQDHVDFGDFNLMTDGYTVWLSEQAAGWPPSQQFKLSKARFNRLLRWYLSESELRRSK